MKFALIAATATAINIRGDGGIVDAVKSDANCAPRLWISRDEMEW